jgi:alkylated DNA repair dioxygenase AlkB
MLFDLAPVPGLKLGDELIGRDEEQALIEHIAAEPLTPFQFHGFEGKRLTRSFGWHYDFATQQLSETEPLPTWLLPVRERCARFAGLAADALEQALLIRYDPGAGIGWHRDRPVFEEVVGLSLGASATLDFRRRLGERRFARVPVPLAPRSAYLLSGAARHEWEHGIRPHGALRFSITFRALRNNRRTEQQAALAER